MSETFKDDMDKAFFCIMNRNCISSAMTSRYVSKGSTFYDNIPNFLKTFASVGCVKKFQDPNLAEPAQEFLWFMVNVSILGMLTGQYVYGHDLGFSTKLPEFAKSLGISRTDLQHCITNVFNICSDDKYIQLQKVGEKERKSFFESSSRYDPPTVSTLRQLSASSSLSTSFTNNKHYIDYYNRQFQQQQPEQAPSTFSNVNYSSDISDYSKTITDPVVTADANSNSAQYIPVANQSYVKMTFSHHIILPP